MCDSPIASSKQYYDYEGFMKNEIVLVLASQNKGKMAEIQNLLKNFPITIKNLDAFGPIPDIPET